MLALLVAGNLFCMACPFMLPREVGRWLGAKWGLQGNVPKFLRNKWLAALLLIIFFISYEYWDLWASPWLTAWILISYFLTALVVDTFFKGAAFCKYVCPLGQFNFFGSLSSPTEIKIRDAKTCAACHTKDCIAGNRQTGQRGCELWLFQEKSPAIWTALFVSIAFMPAHTTISAGRHACPCKSYGSTHAGPA